MTVLEEEKRSKEVERSTDFISGLQVGIANMADSLAAIKKLVYEEENHKRTAGMPVLDDFQSRRENKKIQEMLINDVPKYGNDDDYVDQLVVEAYDSYLDEIKKYPNTLPQRTDRRYSLWWNVIYPSANVGQECGTIATPDGRNAFEPLAGRQSGTYYQIRMVQQQYFKTVAKLPARRSQVEFY